jgi:hypothetical protein
VEREKRGRRGSKREKLGMRQRGREEGGENKKR